MAGLDLSNHMASWSHYYDTDKIINQNFKNRLKIDLANGSLPYSRHWRRETRRNDILAWKNGFYGLYGNGAVKVYNPDLARLLKTSRVLSGLELAGSLVDAGKSAIKSIMDSKKKQDDTTPTDDESTNTETGTTPQNTTTTTGTTLGGNSSLLGSTPKLLSTTLPTIWSDDPSKLNLQLLTGLANMKIMQKNYEHNMETIKNAGFSQMRLDQLTPIDAGTIDLSSIALGTTPKLKSYPSFSTGLKLYQDGGWIYV